jgi:hypothetical protein
MSDLRPIIRYGSLNSQAGRSLKMCVENSPLQLAFSKMILVDSLLIHSCLLRPSSRMHRRESFGGICAMTDGTSR